MALLEESSSAFNDCAFGTVGGAGWKCFSPLEDDENEGGGSESVVSSNHGRNSFRFVCAATGFGCSCTGGIAVQLLVEGSSIGCDAEKKCMQKEYSFVAFTLLSYFIKQYLFVWLASEWTPTVTTQQRKKQLAKRDYYCTKLY
ncbi:hypothetical protein T4D_14016 [Trichinella pseudospiralis]|uniref:Uncharacterized protein n=1 Tax=Trichinella pseudospiralis TaxID=6337 RepID=A0A0V1FX95_TRIPS|nr:hypothetical protein T4D_14016 [Trichinella pseudospiralis]